MTDKVLQKFNKKQFRDNLINWYLENKRDLPWRNTTDPYAIWLSEVMLQQTKVDTVIDYYNKFIERYPKIENLALAPEQEVLKEWEGLGYYSRARNLHHAVKEVVADYDGIVPDDPDRLGKLKGIGPYTQGAILSIAFNQPEPAVDGNVMRVLSRVLAISDNISDQKTRKRFEAIIRELISLNNPSAFNQGLMELGALVCTPRKPACLHCPVQSECRAYALSRVEQLPIKLKKAKQKEFHYHVVVIYDEARRVAIEQRPASGLLANMWQFPMIEKDHSIQEQISSRYGLKVELANELDSFKHIFSHLIWHIQVVTAHVLNSNQGENIQFVELANLSDFPFSVSQLKIIDLINCS